MKKRIFALLLAGLLAVLLTACGEAGVPEASSAPATQSSSTNSPEPSSEMTASSDGEAVAQPTPTTKEINQTITDPELGYTITLKQAIIDIPFDDPDIWYNGYRTGVCIEVELKNDSEYTGGLFGTNLQLLVNGNPVTTNTARVSSFQTFADENNLTPLPSQGVLQGESASGWLFYYYETGSGDNELALRYSRPETEITVIGGPDGGTSSSLPAQDFDIPF